MTTLLTRLLRRPSRVAPPLHVTFYTRARCDCCRKARDLLEPYRRRHGFTIEEVDVDADPELKARYDTTVPVIAVNGKVRFRGVVNRVLLERLLRAEAP